MEIVEIDQTVADAHIGSGGRKHRLEWFSDKWCITFKLIGAAPDN